MKFDRRGSWRAVCAATAVLALGVAAGCGDDDDDSGSGGGGDTTAAESSAPKQPGSLKITATGPEASPTYEVPATVPAGAVKIDFTNNAKGKEGTGAQLVRIEGEHSDREVVQQLGGAMEGKPVADWFVAAGGVGDIQPGETRTVTQALEPGKYYVLGGQGAPKGPPATFQVEAGEGAQLAQADAKIIATEYEFTSENLKAGVNQVELRNDGKEWHHFLAGQLKPGATFEEAKKFLETEKGEPPFVSEDGAVSSTVMDGGISQIVDVELKPGKYAFFCYVSDRKGGPPHIQQGMVSEVTVEE
jgi:uncharacterized cupredoxin-like copper-binding protein